MKTERSYPFERGPYRLDKNRYYTRDFMDREWADLWPNVWLMAALVVDLREPGDHVVFDIGPESILISCDEQRVIRAFHNVCLHRGTRLRDCSGRAKRSFQCSYHGWRWGLDGRLVDLPDAANFPHPVGADRARLSEVKLEIWAGMVWIHLGEPEQGLREYLGPVHDLAAPYNLGDFVLGMDFSTHWNWNWKTALDAFSETYHVTTTHPELSMAVDPLQAELQHFGLHGLLKVPLGTGHSRPGPDGLSFMLSRLKQLGVDISAHLHSSTEVRRAAMQDAVRAQGTSLGVDYSGLEDWQMSDTNQFFVFPNLHFDFHGADEFTLFRYRPHPTDPQRCTFDNMDFFRRQIRGYDKHNRPAHQVLEYNALPRTIQQDVGVMERMHRGRLSRGFQSAIFHKMEGRIVDIHRNIDRFLEGSDPTFDAPPP